MKKIFGINLLRPFVYACCLCFVFLFLVSSMDVGPSWLTPDIIDKVKLSQLRYITTGKTTVEQSPQSSLYNSAKLNST